MDKCFRCERNELNVKLFDGLYGLEQVKVCEKCSIISNIPVIKGPSVDQLRNSEKNDNVRNRLMKLTGLKTDEKKESSLYDEMKKLEENPNLERPDNLQTKLIDNFHWVILTERRRKGLSIKQLADRIGDSESALKLLEKGNLPPGSMDIIKKLELFFKIVLVRKDYFQKKEEYEARVLERRAKARLPPPFNPHENYSDEKTKEISREELHMQEIREKEGEEMVDLAIGEEKSPLARSKEAVGKTPLKLIDFKRHGPDELSIADLKRISERVDKDFTKKTVMELGPEQFQEPQREDVEFLKKTVYKTSNARKEDNSKVPTIYDLMKKKEERDRAMVGREIDLTKEEKEKLE